jgi:DNA-3-methyladenine glycosylase I
MSYCDIASGHRLHGPYHEHEYGFPLKDDNALFERLMLEVNQAGLSWLTILNKKDNFRAAFHGFDLKRVAKYGSKDQERLMADPGIIRNRLKINAAIENARRILALQKSHGSFLAWLEAQHPLSKEQWIKLFKKTFVFTGGEITNEFLMSIGFLPGSHVPECPVYKKIAKQGPAWMRSVNAQSKASSR